MILCRASNKPTNSTYPKSSKRWQNNLMLFQNVRRSLPCDRACKGVCIKASLDLFSAFAVYPHTHCVHSKKWTRYGLRSLLPKFTHAIDMSTLGCGYLSYFGAVQSVYSITTLHLYKIICRGVHVFSSPLKDISIADMAAFSQVDSYKGNDLRWRHEYLDHFGVLHPHPHSCARSVQNKMK